MKHSISKILAVLSLLCLFGCGAVSKKVILSSQVKIQPDVLILKPENMSTVNVALTGLGYDGNGIASSMHSANVQSAGAPAGVGFVGALIGGAISGSMQKSAAIEEKREPVMPLLEKIEGVKWGSLIEDLAASTPSASSTWRMKTSNDSTQQVIVTPILQLSSDYTVIECTALAQVVTGKKKVYQNYFHIHSTPILDSNATLTTINELSNETVEARLSAMMTKLEALIHKELREWRLQPKGRHQSIKFTRNKKTYYERGSLVERTNDYLTYRNLRGEIKHVPFEELISPKI